MNLKKTTWALQRGQTFLTVTEVLVLHLAFHRILQELFLYKPEHSHHSMVFLITCYQIKHFSWKSYLARSSDNDWLEWTFHMSCNIIYILTRSRVSYGQVQWVMGQQENVDQFNPTGVLQPFEVPCLPILSLNQYARRKCKLLNIIPFPVSWLPGKLRVAPKDMKCLQWGWQTR